MPSATTKSTIATTTVRFAVSVTEPRSRCRESHKATITAENSSAVHQADPCSTPASSLAVSRMKSSAANTSTKRQPVSAQAMRNVPIGSFSSPIISR